MVAAVTIYPASGSVIHVMTACEINVTGLTVNDSTAYDVTKSPTEPAVTYYFKVAKSGQDDLKSPVFAPDPAGKAEWHDLQIPASGTWTLTANKTSDNSAVATASVVVS